MGFFQTAWLKLNPFKKVYFRNLQLGRLMLLVYFLSLFLAVALFKAPFTSRTESKIRMQGSITNRVMDSTIIEYDFSNFQQ